MNGLLLATKAEKLPIEIMYMAADNAVTKRRIIVTSAGDNYIKAYCSTRKQKRTFKLENILAVAKQGREKGKLCVSHFLKDGSKCFII